MNEVELFGNKYAAVSDKRIVFAENGRKYEAVNLAEKQVVKIHVDGDLIKEGERCDFALDVPSDKKLYLIELKGTDKTHAYEQLLATIEFMSGKMAEVAYFPRIVVSKDSSPKIKSAAEKRMEKFEKSRKCEKCVVSTRFYSETI